jgi:hypothetical protein
VAELLRSDELEMICKEVVVISSRYYPERYLKRLNKQKENLKYFPADIKTGQLSNTRTYL